MPNKTKKIQVIFIIYWCMLAYIIAALAFWFISLYRQNEQMSQYRLKDIPVSGSARQLDFDRINSERKRKATQYIGEGITFFLVIVAGAVFVHRSVRRQLKQSMQQQNFMMAITHELKTPIAVAQLNLETLQKRRLDETQQHKLIHNTLQETLRLNALCNNMLLSSQIDAGGYRLTTEELDFSELVQECVHDFSNRVPQKPIMTNINPSIFVNGDRLLLQMAVNNLVDNAIKYSPKPSAIQIDLKKTDQIILEVINEGTSIADADKKKVFEKFFRAGNAATKSAKGTGLGLYLTYKVVKAHGGDINIFDHLPSGTRFVLQLKSADT